MIYYKNRILYYILALLLYVPNVFRKVNGLVKYFQVRLINCFIALRRVNANFNQVDEALR